MCVDELHEPVPCGRPLVQLETVVPKLCVFQQMERSVRHKLVVRCASDSEIPLTAVQLGQWIARAVEFWEFEFEGCGQEVTIGIVFFIGPVAAPWRVPGLLHLPLHVLEHEVQRDLLLALITDCGFQCSHRLTDELHRPHNLFRWLEGGEQRHQG
jgi:hypothetical protein